MVDKKEYPKYVFEITIGLFPWWFAVNFSTRDYMYSLDSSEKPYFRKFELSNKAMEYTEFKEINDEN